MLSRIGIRRRKEMIQENRRVLTEFDGSNFADDDIVLQHVCITQVDTSILYRGNHLPIKSVFLASNRRFSEARRASAQDDTKVLFSVRWHLTHHDEFSEVSHVINNIGSNRLNFPLFGC